MNILITGAKGMVGRALAANLKNIRDGKDRTRPQLEIEEIFEYDIDTDPALLDAYCKEADFVFNLAGVNRPKDQSEFMAGNFGFASTLLDTLKKHHNTCPVMISSSIQATCIGRYDSDYGRIVVGAAPLTKQIGETVDQHLGAGLFAIGKQRLFTGFFTPAIVAVVPADEGGLDGGGDHHRAGVAAGFQGVQQGAGEPEIARHKL